MANSSDSLFITYVDAFDDLLKIWGQRDRTCATFIDKQLLNLTSEFDRMQGPPASSIQKGMLCFAKCSDDKYYRVRVTSDVFNNTVTVYAIDYGHSDRVNLSNIRLHNGMNVIATIVYQAEEFFLANVVSRGGWFQEVLNEIRRELCHKKYHYTIQYQDKNERFIQIKYHEEDYANSLLRRNITKFVSVTDQALFLRYAFKNQGQMGNNSMPCISTVNAQQSRSNMVPKSQSDHLPPQLNIPAYPVQTQASFQNNLNQSATLNKSNNNVTQTESRVPAVLNSVMIEALADQLKQHLFKESVSKTTSETVSHNYVTEVLEVGTTHTVYISYIDDGPWSFSIQLVSREHELNRLMDELAACDLNPVKLPVVLGYPCIAKSIEYDNYCRGVVVNITHSAVKIFFVDFGNTEDLPVSSIFELPVRFFKVKTMSQKFALSGLQKLKPSPEIKKAFIEVAENELLLLHVTTLQGENLPTCDLFLKNVNIKRILNEKVLQVMKWTPIEPPKVGQVENVVVTWIESPQKFYVQLKKNDRELENLRLELDQWGVNGEFFNPEELVTGSLCVCCFTGDSSWYRAIVTSVNSKSSVTVFYVDFGNTEEVRPSAIKRIGKGLIRHLNTQAVQCCLHGFENRQTDPGIKTVLEGLILEKELRLKVVYSDRGRIVVKLFDNDNDISLSLLENRMPSKTYPSCAAANLKDETGKSTREKTTVGSRRNDLRNRMLPSLNRIEEKSWRKKEERSLSQRGDVSNEGGWRSDDRKDGKDEKQNKSKRYGFHTSRREDGSNDKNWRNSEMGHLKNMNGRRSQERRGQTKSSPAVSVMERARRAAREAQERGLKMHIPSFRYPVKLENMALHGAAFKITHIPIGSVEEVIVTYFLNPDEIYVQLLPTNTEFRKVMDEIQVYYSTKLPLANFPKKGDLVIAKFKSDEVLYRASVIDSNPLTVRYADYGNEEVTEKERLWPMDKKFLELEAQAIKCSLPNLIPKGGGTWPVPEAQIDKIFEFETYSCKFLTYTDNVYEVELTVSENGKNVRDELISIGFALSTENKTGAAESIKQCSSMNLNLMMNETYRVLISYMVNPNEFYVQLDQNMVLMVEEEVKKYSESQKSTPSLDRDCVSIGGFYLVNVNGDNWRRVKILNKGETTSLVQLIDYGDKIDVAYEQIKPIADHLLDYPTQAVQCCLLSETEECPPSIVEAFKAYDKNIVIAYVQHVLGNRLKVSLYDIEGEKLEFLGNLNNAPSVVRPLTNVPITTQGMAVIVSHVTSPNDIYIQRLSDISVLEGLNEEMLDFYSIGGEDLEPGCKMCAAKSVIDGSWRRARVLMAAEEHAKVFYVDIGNSEKIPLDNVKQLNSIYLEQFAFSHRISLNIDYEPEEETEITRRLSEMILNKKCMGYFAKLDDVLYGELIVDGEAITERLLSDKVKRKKIGLFGEILRTESSEEITEKDSGVFISHVSSPSEFWIHHESISNELEAFQNMLQSVCSVALPKKDVRVGDVVGAQFTDQVWYRGVVLSVEDTTLLLEYLDYGNSFTIDFSGNEVVALPEDVVKVPPFAIFCSLRGQWKETASLKFEEIITKNQDPFTLVELEGDNPKIVDLLKNGISITEQLISEGYDISSGDNQYDYDVYITHVNSPNDFYIQRDGDKSLFDTLISGLLEADIFEDVEEIEENQIYCAKFPENEMWYRAKILKRNGSEMYVHFIDYGNNCTVTEIKLLPPDFLIIPPLALNCSLLYGQANDSWSEEACKKFKAYVSNSAFRMEIVLEGARRSIVKLFSEDGDNLTEILEKLCEPDGREDVCLSYIKSLSDFYVQRMDNNHRDFLAERLKDWETFKDLEKKEVGVLCAAKCHDDGIWYRAELRNICDDAFYVFLIDYGKSSPSSQLKSLPDDIKGIEPLAKNCCLDLHMKNIPESIKEEFINLTKQGHVLRIRVVEPGDRDLVSLMLDGMKLEEVLLYTLSESCEITKLDAEDQNCIKTEIGEKSIDDVFQTSYFCRNGNFHVDARTENETDEEKRLKFNAIASENVEGFRCDDEKKIIEDIAFNSSIVNDTYNCLLEGTKKKVEKIVNGERSEETVAEELESEFNDAVGEKDETYKEIKEIRDEKTSECKGSEEGEFVDEGKTPCEPENKIGFSEEILIDDKVVNSKEEDADETKSKDGILHENVSLDNKVESSEVMGTAEEAPK